MEKVLHPSKVFCFQTSGTEEIMSYNLITLETSRLTKKNTPCQCYSMSHVPAQMDNIQVIRIQKKTTQINYFISFKSFTKCTDRLPKYIMFFFLSFLTQIDTVQYSLMKLGNTETVNSIIHIHTFQNIINFQIPIIY